MGLGCGGATLYTRRRSSALADVAYPAVRVKGTVTRYLTAGEGQCAESLQAVTQRPDRVASPGRLLRVKTGIHKGALKGRQGRDRRHRARKSQAT